MKIIAVKEASGIPKYKQIVAAIETAIVNGEFKKGDQLPSLNRIKDQNSVSRDTVLTAFNELKSRGIIHSIVGKGYYVSSEDVEVIQKIFVLFDEFNSFKEDLYNSFLFHLGENIQVDIFFHHFNPEMFGKLITDNTDNYSAYVIMPANLKHTAPIIGRLPKEKVYILDQTNPELKAYPSIFQNFEKDIYQGLVSALEQIRGYTKLILLYPAARQPKGILTGFKLFCEHHHLDHEVIDNFTNRELATGELYILLDDKNLIRVIKRIREQKLRIPEEIGLISYNDTLMKEVVEGGITTISTDFNVMGQRLAQMILNKEFAQVENPNRLIIRKSI